MILMTIPIHSQKNTVPEPILIYLYLTRCVDNFCNRNYRDEVNRCLSTFLLMKSGHYDGISYIYILFTYYKNVMDDEIFLISYTTRGIFLKNLRVCIYCFSIFFLPSSGYTFCSVVLLL